MAAAAALAAVPETAEACTPPPSLAVFPQLPVEARSGVPTDGVIAFRADVYGPLDEALGLLTIEVTGADVPVAGAIETIVLGESDDFGITRTDIFVIWRPELPLQASTDYVASVSVGDPFDETAPPTVTDLAISTGEGAAGPLPSFALSGVELAAEPYGTGPRVCCDVGNTCGIDDCAALEVADRPVLRATFGVDADPMAAQAYVRLSSGVDDALAEDGIGGIAADADGTTYQRTFDAAAGNYCFGAEIVSLIDGSVQPMVSECLAHGELQLTTGDNEGFDAFLEQCSGDPYWEDTGEPYVPGDDGGGSDGSGSDSGSGSGDAGDGDGTEGDGDGGSEGGSDGGSEGDGGGGLDDDEGGCACNVDAPGSGLPAFAMIALAGAWMRRRRRS